MKLSYRGQMLALRTGEPLDFQVDKEGYVHVTVANKEIGFLTLDSKNQPIFSSSDKTQFYLEPKTKNTNQTSHRSELELDDNYLLQVPEPWYRNWTFWYRAIPLIVFIIFLILCIIVWKIGYKHGQQWFIDTVSVNKNYQQQTE
jgi:hypothetical protein